ncbi:MAG: hypothetical protein ACTS6G_00610 [Candidatus Hodgkinia cicadicola]
MLRNYNKLRSKLWGRDNLESDHCIIWLITSSNMIIQRRPLMNIKTRRLVLYERWLLHQQWSLLL